MWWAGLTSKDARAGLEASNDILVSETIDGKNYWMAKTLLQNPTKPASCHLLPGFDEYMLGYKDRSAVLRPEYAQKIVPGGNGMFLSTIVVDGQVVGTWKRVIKKDHVIVTLTPFEALTKANLNSLEKLANHYGHFVGLPTVVHVE